jgi:hypothetical protein
MHGVRDDDFEACYDAETLAALDGWTPRDGGAVPLPSRLVRWSRASTMGVVAAGFAFGLKEVLDPPRDEQIVIEVDADGEPHDLPVRLFLDPDDPSGSLCIVRHDPPPPVV